MKAAPGSFVMCVARSSRNPRAFYGNRKTRVKPGFLDRLHLGNQFKVFSCNVKSRTLSAPPPHSEKSPVPPTLSRDRGDRSAESRKRPDAPADGII